MFGKTVYATMSELSNIALLEKYFNYELNDAEEALFKTKLINDEEFKDDYEIALLYRAQELEKRKVVYKQKIQNGSATNTKIISFRKFLPLSAVAALLIFIGISLFYPTRSFDTNSYLSDLTNPQKADRIDITKSEGFKTILLKEAEEAFNNKNFMRSATKFQQQDDETKLKNDQRYYYAQCLWYNKKYKEALIQFVKSDFGRDAQWYIALCHIKLKQFEQAKPILKLLLKSKYGTEKKQNFMKAMLKKM